MGMGPLTCEILLTFFVAAFVLYKYGNWYRHHILVTVAVLIAWYFSMLIVFVLPLDVSNTIYETCVHDAKQAALISTIDSSSEALTRRPVRSIPLTPLPNNIQTTDINKDSSKNGGFEDPTIDYINIPSTDPQKSAAVNRPSQPINEDYNTDGDGGPDAKKSFKAPTSEQEPSPLLPPGYDDENVLRAAADQMMSNINRTGTLRGKVHGNTVVLVDTGGSSNRNSAETATVQSNPKKADETSPLNTEETIDSHSPVGHKGITDYSDLGPSEVDVNTVEGSFGNSTDELTDNNTDYNLAPLFRCKEPWSHVKPGVFPAFWRVVYWTSQVLTWLVLPIMQSYTKAGEFSVWGKLRSALIDNAIYYGSYLFIVGILLLYIALRPDVYLNGSQLRAIAASASNTWGLFWLVLLLGYGLVEVPRWLWNAACPQFMLNQGYFKSAKLAHERAEAWDHLNDLLQSVQSVGSSIGSNHPLRSHLDTVESRVPSELLDRMRRGAQQDSPHADVPSEKALIRLHKQLLKALQHHNRVETQWGFMVEKVIFLEDAQRNSCSHDANFKHSTPQDRTNLLNLLYTPTIEWLWVCRARGYLLRFLAVISAIVSAAVVWSELTFFVQHPTLSIFAIIVNIAKSNYDYITIEVISSLTMAYIALCAYTTLFSVRVLNLYYLAPHHLTDQYSLIFSGMMLCRLTPPMCLNFLSLIHMDSHVISIRTQETHYTQVMGHMDVISIISDGFNVYFPMMIVALCLATYYSLGSRLLSALGFQQFIGSDGLTTDLIDEGRTLINRECRKRQRQQESAARRQEFTQRFGVGENTTSLYRSARQRAEELLSRPYRRDPANEASQMELLTSPHSPHHQPPDSPRNTTTQYTTSSHYTSDPAKYTGDSTRYSSPTSGHYDTPYTSSGKYGSSYHYDHGMEGSPPPPFGEDARYSRPGKPDKGLFDDV